MNTLTIYRDGSPLVTVDIDERTIYSHKLMGEHKVTAEFFTSSVITIQIGDYVTVSGHNYRINRIPTVTKINSVTYYWNVVFESEYYELGKKLYISTDELSEFGEVGTATDFVTRICAMMNVNDSGWTVGTVDTTAEKTIVFSNQSCMSVLNKVAEEFDLEFSIHSKSISLTKSVGANTAYTFEYGKENGLYKIERQQVSDQNIVTKVYGFGSMTNIPYTYRDRAKRLVFSTTAPSGYGGGDRYLTKNTELYGVIEGQYTNDDIYPNRTAPLTAANLAWINGTAWDPVNGYVEDSAISGFDISIGKIEGASGPPSIVFKSGDLSGQEFEIVGYDSVNKRIRFNPYSDEDGYTTPNPTNVPKAGDLYTLVNIALPQAYIDAAEAALLEATRLWLDENCVPMVLYVVDIDPKYAATNLVNIDVGDRVTVVDSALGINNLIRIAGIEYPLSNPYAYRAYIADFVPYTLQERIIKNTQSSTTETRIVDRTSDELARRNAMRQRQLLASVFDTDGYFDGTRLKPLSVETLYLSVGAKSQNFRLVGVMIKVNYLGDANRVWCSTGELHHFEIPETGNYVWVIGSAYDSINSYPAGLDPNSLYYLYVKCSKAAYVGEWELTTDKLLADPDDGYYHFLVGVIYPVYEGARDYDLSYGMTYINGRTITTGRIQSLDELNFFDLDQNEFRIGDNSSSLHWNENQEGRLVLIGTLVQRMPGEYFPITIFRGVYSPTTTYHKGDMVTYEGGTWIYHNDTPADGILPVEGEYWNLMSSVGAPGADGVSPISQYRGEWSRGVDYYGTSSRVDIVHYNPTGLYYIAKPTAGNPFRGIAPDDSNGADYWSEFGANFDSIATSFLFSEFTYLENVGVRFFEGVPVGYGDLGGSVDYTQPSVVGTPRIDEIQLTGTYGTAQITCNGLTRGLSMVGSLENVADLFVENWYADYYATGVMLSHSGSKINFTEINGEDFQGATDMENLSGDLDALYVITTQSHIDGQKRIDTVTLSGTGGIAYITCDGITRTAAFNDTLTQTATNFVAANAAAYLASNIVVTSVGADIIFTSRYKGEDFTGDTTITNSTSPYAGAISIAGNDIWENYTNSGRYAAICINMKGYMGGYNYFRYLVIGNGKGVGVMSVGGNDLESGDGSFVNIDAANIALLRNPPMSNNGNGIETHTVYVTPQGFLKLKLGAS